jgi:hypothetical protein
MYVATILFFNIIFLHAHTLFAAVHRLPDSIEEEGFRFSHIHTCIASSLLHHYLTGDHVMLL